MCPIHIIANAQIRNSWHFTLISDIKKSLIIECLTLVVVFSEDEDRFSTSFFFDCKAVDDKNTRSNIL